MANKSAIYGYYGGVTNENHYVPPPSPPFTPQPPSIPFYENQANATLALLSSAEQTRQFFIDNQGAILRRYQVAVVGDVEFYEIKTLDDPNDIITYSAITSSVDILTMDGGTF